MKNRLAAWLLISLLTTTASMAQEGFNGTWKVDYQSAMPTKVNIWHLKDGMYRCTSCTPPIAVKADGKDQRVTGQPYDTISVEVLDQRTVVEIEKKNGEVVSSEKLTVSEDGKTVTDAFGNWKVTMTRVDKAATGEHQLSGAWRPSRIESISDRELLVTYKLEGISLSMSRPTGQSYTAKLDGSDAPYKGDPDTNGVALKRVGKDIVEETTKLNGKVVSVTRLTLAADAKSMKVVVKDAQDGSTNEFTMRKQ
jgi:hypothetical protein